MARGGNSEIKGISVKIGGDTTDLQHALADVQTDARSAQKELAQIGRQLKYDPTNTVLLTQKHELLGREITATKDKLETLKTAQDQFDKSALETEEGAAQYRALEREIEKTESQLANMNKQFAATSKLSVTLDQVSAGFGKVSEVTEKVGTSLSKYVTAPIAAIGAASAAAFNDVDAGMDTVVEKTGATGEALADMQKRVSDIAESIPTDFSTAGEAIGEVNTRFGLTGDALEELSTQFIKFAELNNTDVSSSVDTVQKALSAFGLSADDAGGLLDVLNMTAQKTGASVDTLASGLVQNATAFEEMGLNIDQATVFMGQLETSGANSETVMQGLRKALKNATADGIPLNQALSDLQDTIKNGTGDVDGLTAAYDLFGKSGDQIYGAVKAGTIDFTNLASAVSDAGGSVADTYEATLDPVDKLKITMNELKEVGADLAGTAGELLLPVIEELNDWIKGLKERWEGLSDAEQEQIVKIAGIVAAIGPLLTITGKVTGTVSTLIDGMNHMQQALSAAAGGTGFFAETLTALASPAGLAVAALAGLVVGLGAVATAIGTDTDYVGTLNDRFEDSVQASRDASGALTEAASGISSAYDDAGDSIASALASTELADQTAADLAKLADQTSLTASEQEQMARDIATLNSIYPDLNLQIDANTGKLNKSAEEIQDYIANMKQMTLAQAYQEAYKKIIDEIVDAQEKQIEAETALDKVKEDSGAVTKDLTSIDQAWAEQAEKRTQLERDIAAGVGDLTEKQAELQRITDNISTGMVEYNGHLVDYNATMQQSAQNTHDLADAQKTYDDANAAAQEQIDAGNEKLDLMSGKMQELGISIDGTTDSTEQQSDAMSSAAASNDEYAGSTDQVTEAVGSQIQSFDELRAAVIDDLSSASDTFKVFESDTEITLQSMEEALNSQASVYNSYADNINAVMSDTRYQTDDNFRAMANAIMQMGLDGADYMQQFVNAINGDGTALSEILQDYGNMTDAKNRYADNIAQMQYLTQDGVDGMVNNVAGATDDMSNAAGQVGQAGVDAVKSKESQMGASGTAGASKYVNGMLGQVQNAANAASTIAGTADRSIQLNHAYWYGSDVGASYASGISSQYRNAQNAASGIAGGAANELADSNAYTWGVHLGSGFASGIASQYSNVINAAYSLAHAASAYLHHSTPDEGPLAGDDKWGAELAENFASGIVGGIGKVREAAKNLASAASIDASAAFNFSAVDTGLTAAQRAVGSVVNVGGVTIKVYQQAGQSAQDLVDEIDRRLSARITKASGGIW